MNEATTTTKPEALAGRTEGALLACPCGATPTALTLTENGQGGKWAMASGNCCNEWSIEFRTMYLPLDSIECMALAVKTWNEAPRAS